MHFIELPVGVSIYLIYYIFVTYVNSFGVILIFNIYIQVIKSHCLLKLKQKINYCIINSLYRILLLFSPIFHNVAPFP